MPVEWMWQVTAVVVAVPVVWAFAVMCWWAVADLREWWWERLAAHAAEYDEDYVAPGLPASRPAVATYMRALTVAVAGGAVLAVALLAGDAAFVAGTVAYTAVRAGRELRAQLRALRDRAVDRVPTL